MRLSPFAALVTHASRRSVKTHFPGLDLRSFRVCRCALLPDYKADKAAGKVQSTVGGLKDTLRGK
jgi:hypothetical protein